MFVVKVYCKIETVNFHYEHFIDPTNCPWVSEDATNRDNRTGQRGPPSKLVPYIPEMVRSIWCTIQNFRNFGLNGKSPLNPHYCVLQGRGPSVCALALFQALFSIRGHEIFHWWGLEDNLCKPSKLFNLQYISTNSRSYRLFSHNPYCHCVLRLKE